jgi:hypothetical protein
MEGEIAVPKREPENSGLLRTQPDMAPAWGFSQSSADRQPAGPPAAGYPPPGQPAGPFPGQFAGQFAGQPAGQPLMPPPGQAPTSRRTARAAAAGGPRRGTIELGLDVAAACRWLWTAMAVIVGMDFAASIVAGLGGPYLATRFFDGDYKVNFPTGYKLALLLVITVLFALLARVARRDGDGFAPGWTLLALVGGFALLDETVWLHQSISEILHHGLHTSGVLKFAWTVVYLPAVIAVLVILLRYLKYLAPSLRWWLLAGGALYGGGAVLLEPVKSHFSDTNGEQSLPFKLSAAVSDSAEMIGLTVLAVVLLTELARRVDGVALVLGGAPAGPAEAPVTPPRT